MQTGNIPSDAPEYTLAWDILTWAEENIVNPDGENAGDPWRFTDEQIRFLAHFYAVDEKGKWVYRTASLRRAKGWGKVHCSHRFVSSSFAGLRAFLIGLSSMRIAPRVGVVIKRLRSILWVSRNTTRGFR